MRRESDYQGSTNWETWNVKLWMDNEAESQQHAQALVTDSKDENEAAAQLQDWAIREYIGPHNRDAIEDAHDWNSIPEEERIDHELESMKERNPEDEDMFNDLFGQGGVKDVEPTIIDPEMVNWLEIVQSIKNSLAENHEWEFNLQKGKELGIDFMHQHGSDPDEPKNRMYDAWMRHHNALSDDEITAQGGKTWDHPQAENKLMMWNPIEAIKAGGSEYGWPQGFGDKHVQEIEQNGGWNERVSEVGRRAVLDALYGRENPYHPKLREAMQARYSPEQIEQMMQPQYYYDEYADKYLPLEQKPKLVDPAFDQPGDLTIPEKWGHIANYLNEEEVRALPPDENPFAWRPGDIIQDRNGHRIYITDSIGASGSVPGIHLESGSNAGIGQDRWNVEVYGEPIGLHWRALQGTYGYKRVQRAQANPLDQPGDMTLPEDWHTAAGHGWDTMFAQDMANLKYDDPDDYYSIRRPFLVGFDSIEDPSPEVWIGSPGEYHHDVDRSHPVQQKAKRFFGEIWENTDPPVFRNADGAGFFDKYAIPYAERQYFQEQGMKKRAGLAPNPIMYHMSERENHDSIMREGLRPSDPNINAQTEGLPRGIYLFDDPIDAQNWANMCSSLDDPDRFLMYEVDVRGLPLVLDPDNGGGEWGQGSAQWYSPEPIDPSRIRLYQTKTASDGADYWTQAQDDWWGQENSNLFSVEVPGEAPGMPRNMETGFTKPCWCDVGPTDPHEWSGACENGKRPITHEEVTKLGTMVSTPDQIKMPTSPPDDGWGDAQYDTDTFLDHRMLNNSLKTQEQAEQYKEFLKRHQRSEQAEWPQPGMKEAAMTRQQLLEQAAAYPHPDTSEVVHEWPDGWTVRKPTTYADIDRAGKLVGNCWDLDFVHEEQHPGPYDDHPDWPWYTSEQSGERYPKDMIDQDRFEKINANLAQPISHDSTRRILVDPHGLPHVVWASWPNEETTVIDNALGRHNSQPKPEYIDRLEDFARAQGKPYRIEVEAPDPIVREGRTAADNVPGMPVSDSGHWVWLDGKVGFGEHHHEIAKSLADELGYNKADSAYISNWLARGHCPEDKAVAVGTFKNNRPHIWNSTRDRNAIWDAVMEAREADPSQHIAEVMAPVQMPDLNYVLDHDPEDNRDAGWQAYVLWIDPKMSDPAHLERMNRGLQDFTWPGTDFPKGTYSPAGLTWKQAQRYLLDRCHGDAPCDQIANAVPDQELVVQSDAIKWVIEKVDPSHFSKVAVEVMEPQVQQMPNINYVLDYNPEDVTETGWFSCYHSSTDDRSYPGGSKDFIRNVSWVKAQDYLINGGMMEEGRQAERSHPVSSLIEQIKAATPNQPFHGTEARHDGTSWYIEAVIDTMDNFSSVYDGGTAS